MTLYEAIITILTALGGLGATWFVIAYWIRTRGAWTKEEPGRFLMCTYMITGALLWLVVANQIFDEWPGRQAVTLVIFTAFLVLMWWPLRLLYKVNGKQWTKGPPHE
jgi:hypothetical protein